MISPVGIVSIHAPAWGATVFPQFMGYGALQFQSTHPRGVRLTVRELVVKLVLFQSTHPRGVRRFRRWRWGHGHHVSIHAPAWGATQRAAVCHLSNVSIHAPAWGATYGIPVFYGEEGLVSIHAPAWGATVKYGEKLEKKEPVSIHAPAWGATCWFHKNYQSCSPVSIHAPAWGATANWRQKSMHTRVSIHAPAWGATTIVQAQPGWDTVFQSTHPRGVRPHDTGGSAWR